MSRVFCNLVTPTSYNVYRSSDSLYSYCYRDFIEIIGVLALDQTHNFGLHKQRLSSTLKGSPPKKPSLDTLSGVVPAQYASEVRDIILSPPEHPYTAIKEGLQRRVCPSQRQQLQQLLHLEELAVETDPPNFYVTCLSFEAELSPRQTRTSFFKQLFMEKIPPEIRMALGAIHNKEKPGRHGRCNGRAARPASTEPGPNTSLRCREGRQFLYGGDTTRIGKSVEEAETLTTTGGERKAGWHQC